MVRVLEAGADGVLSEIGIHADKLRFRQHGPDERAHYAKEAYDIEYEFPFGWSEFEGIHNRTDYDLSQHQKWSGKDLTHFEETTRESFLPYVVETAVGLNRTLLVCLVDGYREETTPNGEQRVVLRFHPRVAPIKVAVFPLVRKDGMPEKARDIERQLRPHFAVFYDEGGAVGRRYRRMDEAGTPFCITVDSQTLGDDTVTIRDRDSMEQIRWPVEDLAPKITEMIEQWQIPQD